MYSVRKKGSKKWIQVSAKSQKAALLKVLGKGAKVKFVKKRYKFRK